MSQSLSDIDAYYLPLSSGDRFVLRLIAPAGTNYSQGMEIAEDQRLRGLIKWFQDQTIDTGSIWTGDISDLEGLSEVGLVRKPVEYRFDMDISDGGDGEHHFRGDLSTAWLEAWVSRRLISLHSGLPVGC